MTDIGHPSQVSGLDSIIDMFMDLKDGAYSAQDNV